MKILTVVFRLGPAGTERAAQNFAEAYKDLGHDSRILLTTNDPQNEARIGLLSKANITCYCYSEKNLKILQDWDPEIIHIHSHMLRHRTIKELQKHLAKAKLIETNVFSEPSPWEATLHKSFQLSHWCKALYQFRKGNKSICSVVPNPINIRRFNRATPEEISAYRSSKSLHQKAIVIGRIGSPSEAKWSPFLIDSFNRLCKDFDNLNLLLIGAPRTVVERAKASPYQARIVLENPIDNDLELSIAYSSIDIFSHIAEIGESFGMVLAESLLCETPVLTLSTPWGDNSQSEVIGGHGTGGFEAISLKEFDKYCRKLLSSQQLRVEMGKRGRLHITNSYNSHSVAQKALDEASRDKRIYKSRKIQFPLSRHQSKNFNFSTKLVLKFFHMRFYTRYTTGYLSWMNFCAELVRNGVKKIYSYFE